MKANYGNRSKETPIESEQESGNNDEYGFDVTRPERFAGRVIPTWGYAKRNGRGRQWA